MKLTIEKLAPYLSYGLNTKFTLSDVISLQAGQKDEIRDKLLTSQNVSFVLRHCKPILRPLSDLTKEIKINGEEFEPLAYLIEEYYTHPIEEIFTQILEDNANWVYHLDYYLILHLLEWHFDIYGLIEAGLAIDINTL